MKTEEIKPGDILYDEERKMLVKVARVDEDGVVKYSAITDMKRIFQTPPPPYRRGTRTADAYVPATDEQRKYMERNLAVCEYVNLPKDNRIEVLAYIIADLKAENMDLLKRMQNISSEFADVLCRLNEKEKRMNECASAQTLVELRQMQEQCDKLERENRELKRFEKAMHEFVKDKNICMRKDSECPFRPGCVHVGSLRCLECGSCLGVIEGVGVICDKILAEASLVLSDYACTTDTLAVGVAPTTHFTNQLDKSRRE